MRGQGTALSQLSTLRATPNTKHSRGDASSSPLVQAVPLVWRRPGR